MQRVSRGPVTGNVDSVGRVVIGVGIGARASIVASGRGLAKVDVGRRADGGQHKNYKADQ